MTRHILLLAPLLLGVPAFAAGPADDSAPAATNADESARSRWQLDMRTVEQQVNDLKEGVVRSKASLQLVREAVLANDSGDTRVVLRHDNRLGRAYGMSAVRYYLDGKNIYARMDPTGSLDRQRQVKLLDRALPPGPHNVQVNLTLRGKAMAVFQYLQSYSFKVLSSYTFTIVDGQTTDLTVVTRAHGGLGTSFVQRPTVEYQESVTESAITGPKATGRP